MKGTDDDGDPFYSLAEAGGCTLSSDEKASVL